MDSTTQPTTAPSEPEPSPATCAGTDPLSGARAADDAGPGTRAASRSALVIRHVAFEDLGILAPVLAERGLAASTWDAGLDDVAALAPGAAADSCDLLVVLGGPIGVGDLDAYPVLEHELAAIRRRLAAGRPVLGICLGAQLIAAALGGGAQPGAAEIGWAPLDLPAAAAAFGASGPVPAAPAAPDGAAHLLAPLADLPVLHWHGDRIVLPSASESAAPGSQESDGAAAAPCEGAPAVVLASTSTTPVQAFTVPGALGLQFHLEADPARIERWLIGHAHELAANRIDLDTIRRGAVENGPRLVPAGQRVVDDWLASVGV